MFSLWSRKPNRTAPKFCCLDDRMNYTVRVRIFLAVQLQYPVCLQFQASRVNSDYLVYRSISDNIISC
ncbi:hypothetical protein [cyanobacterium endosymbiont of Rhopalodia gibberula]|uniref:hypothetical protein n=1 Tax=cyanobacterium endosymbiont of Rhopalodia gibberula TaxID=1763363 RepID=UPI000E65BBCC|nr:hypothetical protein [cyanobacterium endosymbiont of Rhopalodia gibberula]